MKFNHWVLSLVLFPLALHGCKAPAAKLIQAQPKPPYCPSPTGSSGQTYFADDFEGTSVNGEKLIGWNITSHQYVSGLYFNNVGGPTFATQSIVNDPNGGGRKVLFAQTFDDDPSDTSTTRAQMTLRFKDGVNLPIYHTSHRVFLHPDIAELSQFSGKIASKGTSHWFTIYEIWNARNEEWDGDSAGSARWSFALQKESGLNQPFSWEITAETMQPASAHFQQIWPKLSNTSVPVPIGKWMTIDYYFKRGQGSEGHILITMTPDGGQTQEIFNIHNTTVYPGRSDILLRSLQPFKIYTSDTVIDWMRERGKVLGAYYNDFKWFVD